MHFSMKQQDVKRIIRSHTLRNLFEQISISNRSSYILDMYIYPPFLNLIRPNIFNI